jgi:hypothetical protein
MAFRSTVVERGMLMYTRPRAPLVLTAAHKLREVDMMREAAEDVLRGPR